MNFFSLPTSLSCLVLSAWIDMKTFVILDSVVCAAREREHLRNLANAAELVLKERIKVSKSPVLKWLLVRKIKIETLELDGDFDENYFTEYLHGFGQHLRKVVLNPGCTSSGIALITSFCRGLKVVHSSERTQVLVLCELLKLNLTVTELRLEQLENEDIPCLDTLHCTHLQRFSLCDCEHLSLFPWRILVGPQLKRLHLEKLPSFKHDDFTMIGKFCSNLESLAVLSIDTEDRTVAEFASLCSRIAYLDLAGNSVLTDVGILNITQNLTQLRRLMLINCLKITHQALQYITINCHNSLEEICVDADKSNLNALSKLLLKCRKVRNVFLGADRVLDPAALEQVFISADQLHELGLMGFLASEDALCLAGKYCHDLRQLLASRKGLGVELPSLRLDVAPCKLIWGCPHLITVGVDDKDVVPSAARHIWQSIRPQVSFEFGTDASTSNVYSICDIPDDTDEKRYR